MTFYTWQSSRCAFQEIKGQGSPALLLIHPIGVGLSGKFWQPFIEQWTATNESSRGSVYNLDLLGCGDSDMPQRAYMPKNWAEQLAYFIEQVAKEPVVLVVQGALLPVAVELINMPAVKGKIKGMVLSGPPAWRLMTTPTESWKQKLAWSFFSSPLGKAFYRYARREKFLDSFSKRQLFERAEDVTAGWLSMLHKGSRDLNSRYAVFSFLAGFWRQDYASAIAQIQQPVMIVMGNTASTIDRTTAQAENKPETMTQQEAGKQRLQTYLDHFPRAQGVNIVGRNVLPYESVEAFAQAIAPFVTAL